MARKINLKFAPDVRFRVDEDFDKASKIDALLNSAQVRRDLSEDETDDDPSDDDQRDNDAADNQTK